MFFNEWSVIRLYKIHKKYCKKTFSHKVWDKTDMNTDIRLVVEDRRSADKRESELQSWNYRHCLGEVNGKRTNYTPPTPHTPGSVWLEDHRPTRSELAFPNNPPVNVVSEYVDELARSTVKVSKVLTAKACF